MRNLFLEPGSGNQLWPDERQAQLRADEWVSLLHTSVSSHDQRLGGQLGDVLDLDALLVKLEGFAAQVEHQ